MKSAKALNQIANQHKLLSAKEAADILNSKGTKYTYKVGDKVAFYYPPTQKEAKTRGRKVKHLLQFRGPAEIVKVLSSSNSAFRIKYNDKFYNRSVINLRPYKAQDVYDFDEPDDDDFIKVGQKVAVIDNLSDQVNNSRIHIAEVIDVTDDEVEVWYMMTFSNNIKTAKWKFVYAESSGKLTTRIPTHIARNESRLTSKLDDELFMLKDIKLTKNNSISTASIRALRKKSLTHHVAGKTWAT